MGDVEVVDGALCGFFGDAFPSPALGGPEPVVIQGVGLDDTSENTLIDCAELLGGKGIAVLALIVFVRGTGAVDLPGLAVARDFDGGDAGVLDLRDEIDVQASGLRRGLHGALRRGKRGWADKPGGGLFQTLPPVLKRG